MVIVTAFDAAPAPERETVTLLMPLTDEAVGRPGHAPATSSTTRRLSVPPLPTIESKEFRVAPVPKMALKVSLPAVPVTVSTPVVSVPS